MKLRVIVQPQALEDLDAAYRWAAKHAPETAGRWLQRFEEALQSLEDNPQRWPLAPENEFVSYELRQTLFGRRVGTFRVLFTIIDQTVHILHIRRAARDTLAATDFPAEDDLPS